MRLTTSQQHYWRVVNNLYARDGRVTVNTLVTDTRHVRSTVFKAMQKLTEMGLVSMSPTGRQAQIRPVRGVCVDRWGVVYHEVCHAGQAERAAQPEAAEGADEDDRLATPAAEDAGRPARDVGGLAVMR